MSSRLKGMRLHDGDSEAAVGRAEELDGVFKVTSGLRESGIHLGLTPKRENPVEFTFHDIKE